MIRGKTIKIEWTLSLRDVIKKSNWFEVELREGETDWEEIALVLSQDFFRVMMRLENAPIDDLVTMREKFFGYIQTQKHGKEKTANELERAWLQFAKKKGFI